MIFEIPVKWKYDEKSKCWIVYSKKYGISGYGKTNKKAKEMFLFTIDIILKKQ